jgi:predicted nucleic acid-binding protein
VLLDTNVLLRHLTGQPPRQARRATALLRDAERLLVPDLIIAELVYVLESVYKRPRPEVAALVRAVLAFGPVETADESLLLRAVELYEVHRIDFAEAYLAATAEQADGRVASFDRGLDRVKTVQRIEP